MQCACVCVHAAVGTALPSCYTLQPCSIAACFYVTYKSPIYSGKMTHCLCVHQSVCSTCAGSATQLVYWLPLSETPPVDALSEHQTLQLAGTSGTSIDSTLHTYVILQGVSSATRKFRSKLVVKRFEELAASGAVKLAQSPVRSACYTLHSILYYMLKALLLHTQ
jgi:hypothetical protein